MPSLLPANFRATPRAGPARGLTPSQMSIDACQDLADALINLLHGQVWVA